MMDAGRRAATGGMPLYKYVGNRILTAIQNALLRDPAVSEFHSGYRVYSVSALRRIRFGSTPTTSTSTPRSSSSC